MKGIFLEHREIQEILPKLPQSSGVYIMKGNDVNYLYIGKANNLRNRIKSYFSNSQDSRFQVPFLLKKVVAVDWIATTNEVEALILEANMIRKYKPPYNVELKDDKHYPYLKISTNEPFPRLFVVRRVIADNAKYFGPYTDAGTMRRVMEFAKKVFQIRNCRKNLPHKNPVRPCINYSIKRCSAPCAMKIKEAEYKENISHLIQFLNGRRKDLLARLEERMHNASETLDFEHAARLRDQIKFVSNASLFQKVDLKTLKKDIDVFGVFQMDYTICLCILSFKNGFLISNRKFLVEYQLWYNSRTDREAIVLQYYLKYGIDPPNEIVLPVGYGFNQYLLKSYFEHQYSKRIVIVVPVKGQKKDLISLAEKNARLYISQKAHFDSTMILTNLAKSLNLPRIPVIIEAFDISNLGGSFTVAGMVQYKNGLPVKSNYRRYKIKTVYGQNDFAMLIEAVTRRLRRLYNEKKPFPDLLLIDGGKGQLSSAVQPLSEFSNPPMVASLAKREEKLFSVYSQEPVKLSTHDPVLKLLQRIRDDVHRLVITYHRTIRDKQYNRSSLEKIPGIGRKRAQILLRHFGSIKKIQSLSVNEITDVKGISRSIAELIIKQIHVS
ncbi:MAG: excinuclease ABC subunit UvrC [Chitinispirillia bacterium]|jgi:excinuclease ABC subunit C